jgi:hypothetical protein
MRTFMSFSTDITFTCTRGKKEGGGEKSLKTAAGVTQYAKMVTCTYMNI